MFSNHRFTIEGHADTQPLVPNTWAGNRVRNRRVEVTIVEGRNLPRERGAAELLGAAE